MINAFDSVTVLSVKLIGLVIEDPLQESSSQDSCGTDQMAVKTVAMTNAELLIAQSCVSGCIQHSKLCLIALFRLQ